MIVSQVFASCFCWIYNPSVHFTIWNKITNFTKHIVVCLDWEKTELLEFASVHLDSFAMISMRINYLSSSGLKECDFWLFLVCFCFFLLLAITNFLYKISAYLFLFLISDFFYFIYVQDLHTTAQKWKSLQSVAERCSVTPACKGKFG